MRKRLPDRDDVWTPEDARRVLDEAEQSGEPQAVFARRHGVGPAQLYWWRKRLATQGPLAVAVTPTLSLVPAMVAREPTIAPVVRLPGDVTIESADGTPGAIVAITTARARSLP